MLDVSTFIIICMSTTTAGHKPPVKILDSNVGTCALDSRHLG